MSGNHAIVIGASLAGLVAARVLADHFTRVTVLDRDVLPVGIDNRNGVPQGRHGHGLLASGYRELTAFFPRLEERLIAAGAERGDVVGSIRWFQHGHYKAKFVSGLGGILMSRPLLEGTIRQLARQLPNVSIVDGAHVTGLVLDGDRVTGVRVRQGGAAETTYKAALVLDASGRASRAPEWLRQSGFDAPETETVAIDLGYTTRTFKRRAGDLDGDLGAIIAPRPPHERRVGFILAMERDRWMVTIGGWLGDHAPTDARGYVEFARSLARPDIYDVIKDAEPLSDAVSYRFPFNQRRRYERLTRFPGRFLVMGDAVCSFNPIYGQGMSVAALQGQALAACLRAHPSCDGLWTSFSRSLRAIVETPWMIAAGSDFAFAGVTGAKPRGTDIVNRYLSAVHRAAARDRVVCRAFFDVANLLAPATTLFRPAIVARVTRECLRKAPPPPEKAAGASPLRSRVA